MQDYQYAAWVNTDSKTAFFNAVYTPTSVGDLVNGAVAVAIGQLIQIEAVVDSINATLPALPSFSDLLAS